VEIRAQCAPETAAWCLHFMYTRRMLLLMATCSIHTLSDLFSQMLILAK
jgi:hypothetical protein